MKYRTGLCCVLCIALAASATAQEALPVRAAQEGVLARLYTGQDVGEILRVAGQGQYLYTAVRDLEGDQHIDVWAIRPPAPPRLVDSLPYGNVLVNTFAFTPVAIVPRNGVVVIQAEEVLRTYQHDAEGRLVEIGESLPVTGHGAPLMSWLSAGGAFASHLQQVVKPPFVQDVGLDELHQEVLVSLHDPAHPFLVRDVTDERYTEYLHTPKAVNTVLNGEPASITFDPATGELIITQLHRRLEPHLGDFWPDKLDALFQTHALDASIGVLIEASLDRLHLPALRAELLAGYQAALDLDALTIEGLIRGQYEGSVSLAVVLEEHGITLDMPLRAALARLAVEGLSEQLAVELGADLYGAALEAWLDETLGVAWNGRASADIAADLALAFNGKLDTEGVASYLTLYVIAPMLDNPEIMTWTLQELLDWIADSDVGDAVDTTLTVTGLGTISFVLDKIDSFPGVSLPSCSEFPRSARRLLDLAFYSGGADLDPDGLAWFELMKFYQYLTGSGDFEAYVAELDAALRAMHLDLAEDFTEKYVGFFSGASQFFDTAEAFSAITAAVPSDQILGDLLAGVLLDRLEAAGVEDGATVETALKTLGIAFDPDGQVDASVDELIAALAVPGVHAERVGEIFAQAELAPFDLEARLRIFLQAQVHAVFGLSTPDLNLRAAMALFIGEQMDLGGNFALHLEGIIDEIISDAVADVVFGGYLTTVANAFDGDCIALWLVRLDAAAALMSVVGLEGFPLAAKAALTAGYDAAVQAMISAAIEVMVQVAAGELLQHYPSWTERIVPETEIFDFPLTDAGHDLTLRGAYAWEDEVIVIVEYRSQTDPFSLRQVEMQRLRPGNATWDTPSLTLGDWEHLDFLNQAGRTLYLGGRHSMDGGGTQSALLIDLEAMAGRQLPLDSAVAYGGAHRMTEVNDGAVLALVIADEVVLLANAVGGSTHLAGHAGDPDRNGHIDLTELLRVVQFFNTGGYYCAEASSEDGYAPQTGHRNCTPHSSDYAPQDWRMNLSELLRLIQFYNVAGYRSCPGTEDGYCPGIS
jgi:hypothetical protein